MDPQTWLIVLTLGGFLGMVGQGARAIVGLKKESDSAAAAGQNLADRFRASTLVVSLMIGFVAGVLAMVGLVAAGKIAVASVDGQTVATLLGAGYAGADFIEGFMQRETPPSGGPAAPTAPRVVVATPASVPEGPAANAGAHS